MKTGQGWNWLWAAEKCYGGEESDQRLRAGNKPPGCEELSLMPLQNAVEAAENWALSWHGRFGCAKTKMITSLQNTFFFSRNDSHRERGNKSREQPQASWTYSHSGS